MPFLLGAFNVLASHDKMSRIIKFARLLFLLAIPVSAISQQGPDPNVLLLDGTWEIIFDHNNEGKEALWHTDAAFDIHPSKQEILVPSCWEEVEKDYEGVAFYRRKFTVPGDWEGKTAELTFDAVNYLTEVWINDQVLGFHEGGFTPFRFRVDRLIRAGEENTLTLRVVGPILLTDKNIDGMGRMEVPQWRGAITGGIWQPVSLERCVY
jgi:beta-galactosidase/beta-glucuronidase